MNTENCKSLGCEVCKVVAYSDVSQLTQIAVHPDGPTFLRRCNVCGTYWHETLRVIIPITTEQAMDLYPVAF